MVAILNLFLRKYLFDDFRKGISPLFLPEAGKVYANDNLNASCELIKGGGLNLEQKNWRALVIS